MAQALSVNINQSISEYFASLPPRTRAIVFAFSAVTGWATWPALAVYADPVPPLLILGLGACVGFLMTLLRSGRPAEVFTAMSKSWRGIAVVTVGVVLNDFFYLTAISRIGAAEANVVHYLWPIFLCLIVALVVRRRPSGLQMIGILIAFCGAVLAIGPGFNRGFDVQGLGFGVLGGLTFAIYSAIRTSSRDKTDVVGPAMGVIAIVSLLSHCLLEEPTFPNAQQLIAIAAIGIIPLTLSTMLWDQATRTGETSTISALAYFNPIIALLILAVLGAANVSLTTFVAAMLIVLGAFLSSRS